MDEERMLQSSQPCLLVWRVLLSTHGDERHITNDHHTSTGEVLMPGEMMKRSRPGQKIRSELRDCEGSLRLMLPVNQ